MRHLRKCVSLDNKFVYFTEYTDKEIQDMQYAWFFAGAGAFALVCIIGFCIKTWLL